jgi:8-oxo-dGTP pyrophosphatase MutT (NUDIX family)
VALVLTSGCLGFFGSQPISDDRLDEEPPAPYTWDSDVNAHITITENARFQAVYRLNRSSVELFRRDGFGGRNSIPVSAVRYRYPNGTIITGTELRARGGTIDRSRSRVSVTLPSGAEGGKLAFASESTPKRFSLPTFVNGSYAVVLPPDRRVEVFPFGKVNPGGYTVDRGGDRRVIHWESVETDSISVQFYLQRDLYIFGGAAAIVAVVGDGGLFYYKRRIDALREQREELGLDVDTEDDEFGDDPPPGMG